MVPTPDRSMDIGIKLAGVRPTKASYIRCNELLKQGHLPSFLKLGRIAIDRKDYIAMGSDSYVCIVKVVGQYPGSLPGCCGDANKKVLLVPSCVVSCSVSDGGKPPPSSFKPACCNTQESVSLDVKFAILMRSCRTGMLVKHSLC